MKSRLFRTLRNLIIIGGTFFAVSRAFADMDNWPPGTGKGGLEDQDGDSIEQVDGGDIAEE